MTGIPGRLEDVYRLNLKGDFEAKMVAIRKEMDLARSGWEDLTSTFEATGAVFRTVAEEIELVSGELSKEERAAILAKESMEGLDTSSKSLAKARNLLIKQGNRLNASLQAEQAALLQASKDSAPAIIQARARAAATKQLTAILQKKVQAEILDQLALEAGVTLERKKEKAVTAQAIAQERLLKAQKESAVQQLLASQGLDRQGRPLKDGPEFGPQTLEQRDQELQTQVAREKAKRLSDERLKALRIENGLIDEQGRKLDSLGNPLGGIKKGAEEAGAKSNNLLFTFRRLIGVMAAFTIARQVTSGFVSIVSAAVRLQASLETNRLGLAGLIAAAGDVRDAQGQQLSVQDQLNASYQIAVDQQGKLRAASLRTAATFEELNTAFTQAVAPGLTAGLSLDQIREATVSISQAATGLGVAQSQLAEEIRSLFSGTINPRNTRIATALGITSEDIRRAKQVGDLFGYIKGQFAAITAQGEALRNTFTGQLNDAADALQQLLASTSTPFFTQLKEGLAEIQNAVFERVSPDNIQFSKAAEETFQGLFTGLARGVQALRDAFKEINLTGLSDSLATVGELLGAAAAAVARALSGFFEVAAPAVTVTKVIFATLTGILSVASRIGDAFGGFLGNATKTFLQLALVLRTLSAMRSSLTSILGLSGRLVRYLRETFTISTKVDKSLGGWKGKITQVLSLIRKLLIPLLAIGATLTLALRTIDNELANSILDKVAEAFSFATEGFDKVADRIDSLKQTSKEGVEQTLAVVAQTFREEASEIGQLAYDISVELRSIRKEIDDQAASRGASASVRSLTEALTTGEIKSLEIVNELRLREEGINQANLRSLEEQAALQKTIADLTAKKTGSDGQLYDRVSGIPKSLDSISKEIEVLSKLALAASLAPGFAGVEKSVAERIENLQTMRASLIEDLEKAKTAYAEASSRAAVWSEADEQLLETSKKRLAQLKPAAVAELEIARAKDLQVQATKEQLKASLVRVAQLSKEQVFEAKLALPDKLLELDKVKAQMSGLREALDIAPLADAGVFQQVAEEEIRLREHAIELRKLETERLKDREVLTTLMAKATQIEGEEQAIVLLALQEQLNVSEQVFNVDRERLQLAVAASEETLKRLRLQKELATQERLSTERRQVEDIQTRTRDLEIDSIAASASVDFDQAGLSAQLAGQQLILESIEARRAEAEAENEILKVSNEARERTLAITRAIEDAERSRGSVSAAQTDNILASLGRELETTRKLSELDIARAEAALARAKHEREIADIRSSGTFSEGFSLGVDEFARSAPTIAKVGEDFARGALDSFSQFTGNAVGTGIRTALEGGDVGEAIRQLGIDLGVNLISDLVTDMTKTLLSTLGATTAASQGESASRLSSATAAASIITTAASTEASTRIASATAAAAILSSTERANQIGKILGALSSINTSSGLARGGRVRGFASGGVAGIGPFSSRLPSIDKRDTIPAWLRPGEWVIRPEAVRRYGHGILAALNAGKLNPDLLRAVSPIKAPAPKGSFAGGGSVTPASGVASRRAPLTVRTIAFHDEQTMDRALAAGPDSMLRFVRSNRSSYHAALGGES